MDDATISEEIPERYIVPGLERGLRLLSHFSRQHRTLSAPEFARKMGLPRSTVFRLLTTLEALGFIERTEGGRSYRLGMAVLSLGFEYLASLELTELGSPLLQRLRDEIGYSCNLVVRDGRSIVYVAKVSAPTLFPSAVNLGTRLPAHATVLGRVMLTDLDRQEMGELYPDEELEVYSPSTPPTLTALHGLLEQDRTNGYAMGAGFYEPSITSIATPVRDHTGRVVAALGAALPSSRVEQSRVSELIGRVRGTADELSRLLNYSPSH
ncbi:IclR family transcriptional regulator [Pigmentiphaga sp.]|uniref:IclR family transcriptional regulator n=1 Tax=Pigmentiphaga sp. TaxID=1977564 RepID=UPI00128AF6BE|nr:IclR family transcriptional regulator [Pigmentiphaga sp.]MPS25797.1 IclR family transcriptional regulator [Alcaligenaceae bacterium SAGV5]MPS54385.1 IclR family transcriptional regulator [Alcaligenaceae bacterium SAGV3]MPT58525.1 IclR family transcriptional regulator [Alcaligenaceae bacterium]